MERKKNLEKGNSGVISREELVESVVNATGLEKVKVNSFISSMQQNGILRVIKGGQGHTLYYDVGAIGVACRAIEIKKGLNKDQYGVWGEIRSILGREKRKAKFGK